MPSSKWILCGFFAVVASVSLIANETTAQEGGFVGQLIPPELVMRNRSEIRLGDDQIQEIGKITGEFREKVESLQRTVEQHNQKLIQLLQTDSIEEAVALKQLQSYLDAEQELKQTHFTAMIRIRNVLTLEQRTKLIAKRKAMRPNQAIKPATARTPNETELRLRGKVEQIKKEVESRASKGTPPMEAAKLMKEFSGNMQKGRIDEAEAILDRVMNMLDLSDRIESSQQPAPNNGAMLSQPPAAVTRLKKTPTPKLSAIELGKAVSDLHVEDVAWRRIEWETSLVSGLNRSRSERKPLVLWVFIDRPIDDERC